MRVFRSKNTSFTLKMCILLLGGAVCATNLHSNEPAGENSVVPFQSDNTLAIDLSSETRKLTWKACDGKDVTAEGVLSQAGKGIPRLLLDNTSVFLGKEERLGTESDGRLVRIKGRLVRRSFGSDDSTRQDYAKSIGYFIDVDSLEHIQRVQAFAIVVRSQK